MKKLVLTAFVASLILPTVAEAKNNHPMAGCGLIYMLGVKDNKSKGLQILASTFNNSYGTQTFGITSGTSGCTEDGLVAQSQEIQTFVEVNFEHLRYELSKGSGSYLSALSSLLGVTAQKMPDLNNYLQSQYSALFPSEKTTSTEFMTALQQSLQNRMDLLS
ncbi:MAG: DUF3015 family protein [Elusimicrobiota bacterium]